MLLHVYADSRWTSLIQQHALTNELWWINVGLVAFGQPGLYSHVTVID